MLYCKLAIAIAIIAAMHMAMLYTNSLNAVAIYVAS